MHQKKTISKCAKYIYVVYLFVNTRALDVLGLFTPAVNNLPPRIIVGASIEVTSTRDRYILFSLFLFNDLKIISSNTQEDRDVC